MRVSRIVGPAALLAIAFAALLESLAYGGGSNTPLAIDPGALVRFGVPISTMLVDLSASGLVGALVLSAFAFSSDRPEYGRALDVAAASAAILTIASAATGFFHLQTDDPGPVTFTSQYGDNLSRYVTTVGEGQAWLAMTLIAACLTVLCFAVRNQTAVALLAIVAILTMIPMALQG